MKFRARTICFLSGLLALSGIFGCFLFFNLIKHNVEHANSIKAAAELQRNRQEQAKIVRVTLSEINTDIQSLSNRLVGTDGTVMIIESIQSLSRSLGMESNINSVSVKGNDPKSSDPNAKTTENLILSFSVSGSWNQVYSFLRIIENLPYKSTIQSATIAVGPSIQPSSSKDKTAPISSWNGMFVISVVKNKQQ